jgi:hypothetical protein
MSAKKILSWLLLLFGEAIIIAAFILFKGNMPENILVLNIVVSSLVYGLFVFNYCAPWIDLEDKSQEQVGSLGIKWFVIWLYVILAVATMFVVNLGLKLNFTVQLIIHCVLLFFLLLGLLGSRHAADKVRKIFEVETKNRNGVNEMKTAMRQLKDKMNDIGGLPENFVKRINALEENLRFISPSNNSETYDLERSFVKIVTDIQFAISNFSMNEEQIESNLKKLERVYQNRKDIYSA